MSVDSVRIAEDNSPASLCAGTVFLQHYYSCDACWNPAHGTDLEKHYEEKLERAKKELSDYRTSRSMWMGLDAIMPGWVDVDYSDLLPDVPMGAFVSNKEHEWLRWLVDQGVDASTAQDVVEHAFAQRAE